MPSQISDEVLRIQPFADHDEWRRFVEFFVGLHHFERIVFRLEAADIKNVVPGAECQARQNIRVGLLGKLGAVRNHDRLRAVPLAIVAGDDLRIGDDPTGKKDRERLANAVDHAAEQIPLATMPLDPVDVDRDRDPRRAQKRQDERVGGVADQNDVEAAAQCIECRQQRVAHRLEILVANRGENDALDAIPRFVTARAAINRNFVSPRD